MRAEIEGPLKEGYRYDTIDLDGIARKELAPNHPSNREHWYKPKFEIFCEDENKTIESFRKNGKFGF